MSDEKEGSWAREYRQGRAAQVEQQRVANLIELSKSPLLSTDARKAAARRAARIVGLDWLNGKWIDSTDSCPHPLADDCGGDYCMRCGTSVDRTQRPTDPAWPCSHCGSRDHNTGWHDHTRTQPTDL